MKRGAFVVGALVGALVVSSLAAATPASAQEAGSGPFYLGVGLLNTQPLGMLRTGPGIGVGLTGAVALDPLRPFRLRADFRFSSYGMDNREACLSQTVGCWIQVDIDTNYFTLYAGAGPELAIRLPGSELVMAATAGVAYFGVSSSLRGVDDLGDGIGNTSHFDEAVFAWSTGGELRIPVSRVVSLAGGVQYQHNGTASYVPDGGVTENPDGTLNVNTLTTGANMVAITLGLSIRP